MILSESCKTANKLHRLAKNEPRPRRLARPQVHHIMLLRPVGAAEAGEPGMAEAILVALFSLLVRATAAAMAATCACSNSPREWHFKRPHPAAD
jgi:hypothetical protein